MSGQYKNYDDEDIKRLVPQVSSIAGLIKALGLIPAGGNYLTVKKAIDRLGLNIDHWKGMGWSKGKKLKHNSNYVRWEYIKRHIIKDRGHKCEICQRENWLGSPIPLEMDHKDGDRTNNEDGNLRLLCRNCHALTSGWRNKKRGRDETGQT